MQSLNQYSVAIHDNARNKGFWDDPDITQKLLLIHSEVSEACEADREGDLYSFTEDKRGLEKPEGLMPELADVLIRTLDLMRFIAKRKGYDIDAIVQEKMAYNTTRPQRHGKSY